MPVYEEICEKVHESPVKHADGTGFFESNQSCSIWVIASEMASAYHVVGERELRDALELISLQNGHFGQRPR